MWPARVDKPIPMIRDWCSIATLRRLWVVGAQARAASLQSCVIIIRILRDLCRRIPNWTPLDPYVSAFFV